MIDEAKFNRFSISAKDFEKAAEFLAEAKNHQYGGLVHEALVMSAIICYFRPFTENERSSSPPAAKKLDLLSDFPPLSQAENAVHEACKVLRNKALAHSEFLYHPTRLDRDTGVISSALFSLVGAAPDVDSLAALIEKLTLHCQLIRASYVHHARIAP
jgi:hypothetical protein